MIATIIMSQERGHRTNSSSSPSGNKTPHNMDANVDSSSQRMKKVPVGSLSQPITVTADTTDMMSSVVPSRLNDRMSWQVANWDEMETSFENNTKASHGSRRTSCKSESSASSFYQSLINETEADELLREISKSSTDAEHHNIMGTKRKSMQKCLELDEEAFAISLRSLALEAEKNKEKDEH
mmetsp:Transcript_25620/g.40220  ORF Transcript_25620/g.40220 Transcript_25620/m.40220 type:complete len:182 (+) Transcript_25620:136-681(+)